MLQLEPGMMELLQIVPQPIAQDLSSIFIGVMIVLIATFVLYIIRDRYEKRAATMRRDEKIRHSLISAQGTRYEILNRYYRNRLSSAGIGLYYVSAANERVVCSVATKMEWISLEVDLEDAQCELTNIPPWTPPAAMNRVPLKYRNRLLRQLETSNMRLDDLPIYRLVNLTISENDMKASFSLDRFNNYRKTSGLMIEELENFVARPSKMSFGGFFAPTGPSIRESKFPAAALPLRDILLPDGQSVIDFSTRKPQGGICAMLAIARPAPDNDYWIPIRRRTRSVAIGQGDLSVTPQGLHQPRTNRASDVRLSSSVFRELEEEVFGRDEMESGEREIDSEPRAFEPIKWLIDNAKDVTMMFTYFGINLHQGNYNFGVLIAVHNPDYYKEFCSFVNHNWESELFDNISSMQESLIEQTIIRPDWVPEGRVAFVEGLRRLHAIDPIRVKLPSMKIGIT